MFSKFIGLCQACHVDKILSQSSKFVLRKRSLQGWLFDMEEGRHRGRQNGSFADRNSHSSSSNFREVSPGQARRNRSFLPDGWLDYSAIGELIPGTRILCLKTPIDNISLYRAETSSDISFTSQNFFDQMRHRKIKVGLVIDLTFSTKYYRGYEMSDNHGVQHRKILVAGKSVPTEESYREFEETVDTFLKSAPSDQIVAVHCTHGVNRTGWFVCRYMMEKLSLSYEEAHRRFSEARGHPIHRDYMIKDLKQRDGLVSRRGARNFH